MTPELLSIFSLIFFGIGAAAALAGYRFEALRNNAIQLVTVSLGMLCKTAAIGLGCAVQDTHFFNSQSEIYGLLAWAVGFSLLIALAISAARSLSALISPLIVVLMVLALVSSRESTPTGIPAGRLFAIHIVTAFLGYGLFLTACGASVLYLEQVSQLKRKVFGVLFKDLPSLERLERLEMLCSWVGLAAFTVAIVTGAMQANMHQKAFWTEPKYLAALLTWVIFGALVIGRAVHWLNGRAAAKFVLAGATLVVVTLALSHRFEGQAQQAPASRVQAVSGKVIFNFEFLILNCDRECQADSIKNSKFKIKNYPLEGAA